MVDIIRHDVTSRIKFANYMENEDYLIDQIDKAITRHEDDGADPDEAKEAGWIDKRVFIKRKIKTLCPRKWYDWRFMGKNLVLHNFLTKSNHMRVLSAHTLLESQKAPAMALRGGKCSKTLGH